MREEESMAGDDPLPSIKHGQSGYQRHGCRCFVCRRGKADAQARFRAKQRGEDAVGPLPEGVGPVEASTRGFVYACGPLDDAGTALGEVAVMHAQLLDSIRETGRWHLLTPASRSWRECMRDLAAWSERENEDVEDDFISSLRPLGAPGIRE